MITRKQKASSCEKRREILRKILEIREKISPFTCVRANVSIFRQDGALCMCNTALKEKQLSWAINSAALSTQKAKVENNGKQ